MLGKLDEEDEEEEYLRFVAEKKEGQGYDYYELLKVLREYL